MTGGRKDRSRQPRAEFRARLECGDVIWLRMPPITPHARFGCTAGQNHGYQLWWVEAWSVADPQDKRINREYARKQKKEG